MTDRKAPNATLQRFLARRRGLAALGFGLALLILPASSGWAEENPVDIEKLTIDQAMKCVIEPRFDIKLGAAAEEAPAAEAKKSLKEAHVFAITADGKVLNGVRPEDSTKAYRWSYLDPIVRLDENGKSNIVALNREKGDFSDFVRSRIFIISFSRDQVALANAMHFSDLAGGTASAAWNTCDKVDITDGKMQLGGGGLWPFD